MRPAADQPNVRAVVGVALIRDGQVLAARRTTPPELAGRWEFPGGKVAPGESEAEACQREVAEELGCQAVIQNRLDAGPVPIGGGMQLQVYLGDLVDGEPTPTEHDRLTWLSPEELDDVDWLPADRPFLPELRSLLLDGSALAGGNVGGSVRIGMTVRRPTGPWTPGVHALLRHLKTAGLAQIPEVLGVDERGREILTYLPGRVPDVDRELISDAQLISVVRWIRAYHEAVASFRPGDDTVWRLSKVALGPDMIICHNDLAPYNMAFADEQLCGVFDWDVAGPGQRLDDIAFFAWNAVPLFRDIEPSSAAARLRLIAAEYGGYGGYGASEILTAAIDRMRSATDRIAAGQRAGDEGMLNLGRVGEPARTRARIDQLVAVLPDLERALAD